MLAHHPRRAVALAVDAPHRLDVDDVSAALDVDPASGLGHAEAAGRLASFGANALDGTPPVPAWRRLAAQFTDRLILVLLAAATVAFFVSGELKTPIVVLTVVLLNAVIGFVQEQRAERSLEALQQMAVHQARVRRGGDVHVVAADDLVPGDVVLVEAGDRIPADGRLVVASSLEVDESVLTGESVPTAKATGLVVASPDATVGIGDRACMAHMHTSVTRGRGELVVTATGMRTEIGRIAGLLATTTTERTPLQRQLDELAHGLAKLAAVIVAAVVVIGLVRGSSLSDMLLTGVALAVAAIPEGLPAVTVVTLAIGVARMAESNAIVKRLASVETLGSTTVICSDKTGTLTMNEMTAVELVAGGRLHRVSGTGYEPRGVIEAVCGESAGHADPAVEEVLAAVVLCNDAALRHDGERWHHTGDPTETALLVLAAKGGVDLGSLRARHPRLAEAPFESATKLMATAHRVTGGGVDVVRAYVKGAPDVLLARADSVLVGGGTVPVAAGRQRIDTAMEEMAGRGLRVLAVASRDLDADEIARLERGELELAALTGGLTVLGLVGLLDPPRAEVRQAIAEAHAAGLSVKMITGDHVTTATSIARSLGLPGAAMTGAELDALDDDALGGRLDDVGVFARVSPEHKLRLVAALQHRGNVVAMTGDGVNDAPALKRADIGVAMGITGTEVTKQAASMVLADDNFATIVGAVRRGRTIYDNVVKFVRFQLSTTIGFAVVFLLAALFGLADGKPFAAIAILWVNLVMDGPPAMALGLDPSSSDVMSRAPRPVEEKIVTGRRRAAIGVAAVTMAAGTLAVLAWAPGEALPGGTPTVAGTMAFTTFVLFQFFNLLNVRSDRTSVFHRDSLRNRWLWVSLGSVLVLQVAVTHVGPLQRLFATTSITPAQWAVCALVASSVLWIEELRKLVLRARTPEVSR